MILPFQKNYPLGCNLSCLFLGPWVNFSGTFILLLKQNQPALFFPLQTFMHSAQSVSATVQTWQVSMRAELLEKLKTKYQLHSLPQQPLVKTKGRTSTFSAQERRGWGWERGRSEDSCREAEDPAFSKARANGCPASLAWALSFSQQLPKSQPFPHHSMPCGSIPGCSCLGVTSHPVATSCHCGWRGTLGKPLVDKAPLSVPNTPHSTFAEVKYIFVHWRTEIAAHVHRALWTWSPQSFRKD